MAWGYSLDLGEFQRGLRDPILRGGLFAGDDGMGISDRNALCHQLFVESFRLSSATS